MIRTYSCLHFFFLATALVFVAHTGFCVFECKAISSVWVFEHRMKDGSREGKEGREDGEGGGATGGRDKNEVRCLSNPLQRRPAPHRYSLAGSASSLLLGNTCRHMLNKAWSQASGQAGDGVAFSESIHESALSHAEKIRQETRRREGEGRKRRRRKEGGPENEPETKFGTAVHQWNPNQGNPHFLLLLLPPSPPPSINGGNHQWCLVSTSALKNAALHYRFTGTSVGRC